MVKTHAAAAAVALAALVACSAALPQGQQDVDRILSKMSGNHASESRYDSNGQKVRNLDALGGGNLVRGVRQVHRSDYAIPYLSAGHYDYISPFAGNRRQLEVIPLPRADERDDNEDRDVDVPKGNFDEIDSPFAGNRRQLQVQPPSYADNVDVPKRNFDEIDRTGFDNFVRKRNFDEIDRTGFGTFVKRASPDADLYPLPPYALRFFDRDH